jgi:hypothetical protein
MASEIEVEPKTSVVFPEKSFLHNVDKPFEVHRMIVRIVTKGTFPPPNDPGPEELFEAQPDTLEERVRIFVADRGKNENMLRSASLVSDLLAFNTGFWDWAEPYTIVKSESFEVQVQTLDGLTFCTIKPELETDSCGLTEKIITKFRVEVCFQGFLLITAPPSEIR